MMVEHLQKRWKECKEPKQHCFSPKNAARLLLETELPKLLRDIAEGRKTAASIEVMRKIAWGRA